ncbi:MAG: hypothetical protein WCD37_10140 [Chloroflexia bacterium]
MQEARLRPVGITVLAMVVAAIGSLAALVGLYFIFSGIVSSSSPGSWGPLVAVLGLMFLVFGVLELIFAYGVWKLKLWGWMMGLIMHVILLVYGISSIRGTDNLISDSWRILIPAAIIIYLFTPEARRAVTRPRYFDNAAAPQVRRVLRRD